LFIHLLAGSLVFLPLGQLFGWLNNPWTPEFDPMFIFFGGLFGILPDVISIIIYDPKKGQNETKYDCLHRDNLSHSIFLPFVIFFVIAIVVYLSLLSDTGHKLALAEAWRWAILAAAAILTHPFCDLFGVGWGVKLFYPFSLISYKLFHKNNILVKWTVKELGNIIRKEGRNDWFKAVYFSLNWRDPLFWWGAAIEYPSLVIYLYLIVSRI
jgi:hypothetical protein